MDLPSAAGAPLPPWCTLALARELGKHGASPLDVAIELASGNVAHGTGGPFGAAVASDPDGEIVGIGVNRVIPARNPAAHAEAVAIADACRRLGTHRLGDARRSFTLYVSSAPCIMCLGVIHWSGIRRVVFAEDADATEAIGFDEGPGRDALVQALRASGIAFERVDAGPRVRKLLARYVAGGGEIYNGGR
ncbi:MAG: nucleoside deaminase [Gemmatimonadota bacterium]|nr:nucleoside deaminase [Gemmatimonadota bacterium]